MNSFVVIRYYKPGDGRACKEVIKTAAMSTVNAAFLAGLTTEVHFQVVVLASAVMYIFLNVPFGVCLASAPAVIILMYILIYITHLLKAFEVMRQLTNIPRNFMSLETTGFWVAEIYESDTDKGIDKHGKYTFESEQELEEGLITPPKHYKKSIIGTIGLIEDLTDPQPSRSAWLRYLAVAPSYQRKGVATALLNEAVSFALKKNYRFVTLAFSECHHAAKLFFSRRGFKLKQTYHKHIVGSLARVLKYEVSKDLREGEPVLDDYNESIFY